MLRGVCLLSALLLGLTGLLVPAATAAAPAPSLPTLSVALSLTPAGGPAGLAALARLAAGHPRLTPRIRAGNLTRLDQLTPPSTRRSAVRDFARAHRLRVTYSSRWLMVLSGPGAVLERLFGTHLVRGGSPLARGQFVHPASPLHLPAALSGQVDSAVGLDNRPVWRPTAVAMGYTGSTFRAAYQVVTGSGAGITVGTLQYSGWAPSDLSAYASAAGISLAAGQVRSISVNGASVSTFDGNGGQGEVALDTESILATAPLARQRVYVTTNDLAGTEAAYDTMATDAASGALQVVSQSWGMCESGFGGLIPTLDGYLARIVAAGATVFASSGDEGAYDCSAPGAGDNTLAVDYPASSPYVVGVGGTTLSQSSGSWTESGWSQSDPDSSGFLGYGSGGGASSVESRPSWQSSVGIAGSTRLVPDVASDADPHTGFGSYIQSLCNGWCVYGGTSLASPTWAAGLADALSVAGRTSGVGDIHSLLYANTQDFRDITSGDNFAYSAGPGYDEVTGLGAPDWALLGPLLAPATGPAVAAVAAVSGGGQSTTAGTSFAAPLTVQALDSSGRPLAGATLVFSAPTSGPTVTFGGSATQTVVTDSQGVATSAVPMAGRAAGSVEVQAAPPWVTGVSLPLTVRPGPAAAVKVVAGSGQSALLGSPYAVPAAVQVTDSYGNPVAGVTVAFAAPGSGPSAAISPTSATTGSDGRASLTRMAANQVAGRFQLQASAAGRTDQIPLENLLPAASALTVAGGPEPLPLAWRESTGTIEVAGLSGNSMLPAYVLAGKTGYAPALVRAGAWLLAAVAGTNGALYFTGQHYGTWSGWQDLGGWITSGPALAVGGPTLYVVVRGGNWNYYLRWNYRGRWSGWVDVGGRFASAPSVSVLRTGQVQIAGTGTNRAVYLCRLVGDRCPGWSDLGGSVVGAPSVAVDPSTGTSVVAATGGNGQVYFRRAPAGAWSGWVPMGVTVDDSPSIAALGSDRFAITVRDGGRGYLATLSGTTWTGWTEI